MPFGKIRFFSEDISYFQKNKRNITHWIASVIHKENSEHDNINIIFCNDNYLLSLNKKYLNHKTLTDVITFDYSSGRISGDIYISIERVKENAKKFSQNVNDEINRTIIHGVLHLLGYTDKSTKDKKIMTTKENQYLSYMELLNVHK